MKQISSGVNLITASVMGTGASKGGEVGVNINPRVRYADYQAANIKKVSKLCYYLHSVYIETYKTTKYMYSKSHQQRNSVKRKYIYMKGNNIPSSVLRKAPFGLGILYTEAQTLQILFRTLQWMSRGLGVGGCFFSFFLSIVVIS